MKIINATFAEAVRTPNNRLEQFVTSEGTSNPVNLEYNPDHQLLTISVPGKQVVLVGFTNIRSMTAEAKIEQTIIVDSGSSETGSIKKSKKG